MKSIIFYLNLTGVSMAQETFFLQPISKEIWASKYQLKNKEGEVLEHSINDTFNRVAVALATHEADSDYWGNAFSHLFQSGKFIGAGRIMSNAGASKYKQNTSLINCTVMNQIPDSMDGIMQVLKESAKTLQRGSGVGYDFSTIRPRGAMVRGVGAGTSGPISFMEIYDRMCFTIQSAGGRRGAQMGVMDCQHPDIESFITTKQEDGKFRQFNLSVLITKRFMDAVINDQEWRLWFWDRIVDGELPELDQVQVIEPGDIPFHYPNAQYFSFSPSHIEVNFNNISPEEIFQRKVYKTISARELWNLIMASTYDYAEPGFILIDEVNHKNNLWWLESIRATNPCGEQPLPPNGACLLGSMVLPKYVLNPFTPEAQFDFDSFHSDVAIAARILDNVVEFHGLPIEQQGEEITSKRRHGMGYTGLGNTFALMNVRYGSPESVAITEKITKMMATVNYETGIDLALEKGGAPVLDQYYPLKESYLTRLEEKFSAEELDHYKTLKLITEDSIKGTVLHAMSHYFDRFDHNLRDRLAREGCRYTHATSIAPSGTISLVSNNVSNGIEPPFQFCYQRNIIVAGQKSKVQQEVLDYGFLLYRNLIDPDVTPETLPDSFVSTNDLTPEDHIAVQAAAQRYIDTSISKTINISPDYPFEDFKDVYIKAYQEGLKGVTTFRYNPRFTTGVLVNKDDLEKTVYEFTLENGETVTLKGSDKVCYEGQIHVVSNLFDALKEGQYGKY